MDVDYRSLRRYAAQHGYSRSRHFIEPYARPALQLFNAHLASVVERTHLQERWIRGTARLIRTAPGGYAVESDAGVVHARRVVLAPGQPPPAIPRWAVSAGQTVVQHLLSPRFTLPLTGLGGRTAIVGCGMSAWQFALVLARSPEAPTQPVLIARHEPTTSWFDSHPCYLGPACMRDFLQAPIEVRRSMLSQARLPGTITPEVREQGMEAVASGRVELMHNRIAALEAAGSESESAPPDANRALSSYPQGRSASHVSRAGHSPLPPHCLRSGDRDERATLSEDGAGTESTTTAQSRDAGPLTLRCADGTEIRADQVILATGFSDEPPAAELVARTAAELNAPRDRGGHPILETSLEWKPGLYAAGRLAELELGPSAGTIVGAHKAFRRIAHSVPAMPVQYQKSIW